MMFSSQLNNRKDRNNELPSSPHQNSNRPAISVKRLSKTNKTTTLSSTSLSISSRGEVDEEDDFETLQSLKPPSRHFVTPPPKQQKQQQQANSSHTSSRISGNSNNNKMMMIRKRQGDQETSIVSLDNNDVDDDDEYDDGDAGLSRSIEMDDGIIAIGILDPSSSHGGNDNSDRIDDDATTNCYMSPSSPYRSKGGDNQVRTPSSSSLNSSNNNNVNTDQSKKIAVLKQNEKGEEKAIQAIVFAGGARMTPRSSGRRSFSKPTIAPGSGSAYISTASPKRSNSSSQQDDMVDAKNRERLASKGPMIARRQAPLAPAVAVAAATARTTPSSQASYRVTGLDADLQAKRAAAAYRTSGGLPSIAPVSPVPKPCSNNKSLGGKQEADLQAKREAAAYRTSAGVPAVAPSIAYVSPIRKPPSNNKSSQKMQDADLQAKREAAAYRTSGGVQAAYPSIAPSSAASPDSPIRKPYSHIKSSGKNQEADLQAKREAAAYRASGGVYAVSPSIASSLASLVSPIRKSSSNSKSSEKIQDADLQAKKAAAAYRTSGAPSIAPSSSTSPGSPSRKASPSSKSSDKIQATLERAQARSAMAQAQLRSRQESSKLQEQQNGETQGPSLAPATSSFTTVAAAATPPIRQPRQASAGNIQPGAFSMARAPKSAKEDPAVAAGPVLAPALSTSMVSGYSAGSEWSAHSSTTGLGYETSILVSTLDNTNNNINLSASSNEENDDDIEANVPQPGAFAIEGIEAGQNQMVYDSEAEDASVTSEHHESGHFAQEGSENDVAPDFLVPADSAMVVGAALEAELQVVVDGAVVTDTEENEVDPKAVKRLRFVQFTISCFSLAALALIIGSILGFSDSTRIVYDGEPILEGWKQVGAPLFGSLDEAEPRVFFGSAVAISGNGRRVAISSPGTSDETKLNVGEVHIFDIFDGEMIGGNNGTAMNEIQGEINATQWDLIEIIHGTQTSEDAAISLSMSQDGSRVAIGRPRGEREEIEIYEDKGTGFFATGAIINPIEVDSRPAWFGHSIAMSSDGTHLAVGAPIADSSSGERSGSVIVFQYKDDTWQQLGDVVSGQSANDFMGWSVGIAASAAGDAIRIVAGGPTSDAETGIARIFDWTGSEWIQYGETLHGEDALSRFGDSVSLSEDGKILAIGSAATAFLPGKVSIFRDIEGQWVEDQTGPLVGQEPVEGFGSAVALSSDGNILAIGAPRSDSNSGRVEVLKFDAEIERWTTEGSYIYGEDGDQFGYSIALSSDGKRVLAGAPEATFDGSVAGAGTARVYDREADWKLP